MRDVKKMRERKGLENILLTTNNNLSGGQAGDDFGSSGGGLGSGQEEYIGYESYGDPKSYNTETYNTENWVSGAGAGWVGGGGNLGTGSEMDPLDGGVEGVFQVDNARKGLCFTKSSMGSNSKGDMH